MQQPEASENHVQFAVSLKTDRDGFLRRSCPDCGRDFKTEIDPADLQWEMASQCQRMGVPIGLPEPPDITRLRCPYCGHENASSDMHTDETVEYLKRMVHREYVVPQLNKAFSDLEGSLGTSGHADGMFSISVEFTHQRMTLPPRPFHGPEPSDFTIIRFLCCDKRIKIADTYANLEACSYCGAAVSVP